MNSEDVRPNLEVRVIANQLHGRRVDSEQYLEPGDIIRLTGQADSSGRVRYYRGHEREHAMMLSDLRLIRDKIKSPPVVDVWEFARQYIRI